MRVKPTRPGTSSSAGWQLVGSTGLAAAFATPGLAQQGLAGQNVTAGSLRNPVTEYPKPPFPVEEQDWPGLPAG